jgi:hypothetical protein
MMYRLSTFLTAIVFAMLLLGCASHPPRVNCEGELRPINPPVPALHSAAAHEG